MDLNLIFIDKLIDQNTTLLVELRNSRSYFEPDEMELAVKRKILPSLICEWKNVDKYVQYWPKVMKRGETDGPFLDVLLKFTES